MSIAVQLGIVVAIVLLLLGAFSMSRSAGRFPRLKRALGVWLSWRTTMYSHKAVDPHQKPKAMAVRRRDEDS